MEPALTEVKTWTPLTLITWSQEYLSARGIPDARLNAELLLCHVLSCQRIALYMNFDKPLKKSELERYKSLFLRRVSHEPLQYITGEADSMGLRLSVDRRVFIPRPETEVLIGRVVEHIKGNTGTEHILEIGTGSGNIATALAKFLPGVVIDTCDCSPEALAVARLNVEHHGLSSRIRLLRCDFLTSAEELGHNQYDIIVSNPPYISRKEFDVLPAEVKDFEPSIALTDGSDGLTFYKAIARSGGGLLSVQGGWIFVEMAHDQDRDVAAIFTREGYRDISVTEDLGGVRRVLGARWGSA
jgi:release factor glutamine methyltransferase